MDITSTILTAPDNSLSLIKDIRLVKLALLYSDKVTLFSPTTSLIVGALSMGSMNEKQIVEFYKEVGPIIDSNLQVDQIEEYLSIVKKIKAKKNRSKPELVILGKYKSMIKNFEKSALQIAENFYQGSNFEQLIPVIEAGLLEIKEFDFTTIEGDRFVEYMSNEIKDILSQSAYKYPIFDDIMGDLAFKYTLENDLSYQTQNPMEIQMGKELILQLPNIDEISVENIIKLKNELYNELLRLKGVILDYSKEVESNPFSKDAHIEMKKQYEYNIQPELESLRNQITRNKFLKHLKNEVLSNSSSHLTQVSLLIGICNIFDFEKILSISGVLSETVFNAYKTKIENSQQIKENPLFFYSELSKIPNL